MTQISFDAKQTNSLSKSFSILGAALRVPLIHNKTSLRIINIEYFWAIFEQSINESFWVFPSKMAKFSSQKDSCPNPPPPKYNKFYV